MSDPLTAIVSYLPNNPDGEKIVVDPDPIRVPPGFREIVWLREPAPAVPWRFVTIGFDRPEVIRSSTVMSGVILALDDNSTPGSAGPIKYTLGILDESTGEIVVQDPQIENEFGPGGGDPET